jgi:maltose/moltooligosaccharide transporter
MAGKTADGQHTRFSIVIIFSFWFASWNILWGIYNNYVPVLLQAGGADFNVLGSSSALGFGIGAFAVGIIMSIDNIAGAILKLIMGPLVDQVKSRKKILLIAGTIAAAAYALIPVGFLMITSENSGQLTELNGPFIFTIVILCIMIGGWGVAEIVESSLFHVVVSSMHRSKIVGYRVFIGGLAFILTLVIGNLLYSINLGLPFWIGAGFYSITLALYARYIKEPEGTTMSESPEAESGLRSGLRSGALKTFGQKLREALGEFSREERNALLIISAVKFMLIFGVMAFQTYSSSYLVNEIGITEAEAGNYVVIFFAGYMAAALPAGYLSNRIGRKRLLVFALAVSAGSGLVQYLFGTVASLIPALILLGFSTSMSDIIPLSMAADTAPSKKVMGMTMGIYFFAATLSAIISVPFFGWIFQITGNNYSLMWLGVAISGLVGLILVSLKRNSIGEMKAGANVLSNLV